MTKMQELLKKMIYMHASDLHLTYDSAPLYRVDGELEPETEASEKLTPDEVRKLAYSVMNEAQRRAFETDKEVDFSFSVEGLARFRANVFLQQGHCTAAIRQIPYEIKTIEELGLPSIVKTLTERPNGLVLVTGPTGSGKSTTLAAMIDKINSERKGHILTVEDPLEFVHKHKKCIVNHREVKHDTNTFATALRVALRQDPDIVLIGEMRDLETISAALTIAETGHLTFATLHTNSATQTVNRILDVFPAEMKDTVRTQLSMVLEGIISQALLPKIGGGRTLACEIMIPTRAVRTMIREDKVHQLQGIIEMGKQFGMQTMNSQLAALCLNGLISEKDALERSPDTDNLRSLIGR